MTSELWASLTGAAIGAFAAIGAMVVQSVLQRRDADRRDEQRAIEEVLVRSSAVVLRSHEVAVISPAIASIDGLFARLIGVMAPVDYRHLLEPVHAETIELERAVARVRLSSDHATVARAEAVVEAGMEVLKAFGAPNSSRLRRVLHLLFRGQRPVNQADVASATEALARRRGEFVKHVRNR
ncbi:hypothetical protein [Nocardioides zeae]|uniref:Uncharacterized protein n=1 Tax=Nocardioides zeae TaxID=1457234 RepID=A0A6P0HGK6_9ACTN|nr:hypothetical protein [Nocardioides zeae]NEN77656.1 hypothetical protein [Nocardioides zeae]